MRVILSLMLFLLWETSATAQELYPYTEPASNVPAKSISAKLTAMFMRSERSGKIVQRHMPEISFGVSNKLMLKGSAGFGNMFEKGYRFEAVRLYGKSRFFSVDEVHKHFRMAAFGAATYSNNDLQYNEINLASDQSGVQAGVIATQLWNKFAASATVSWSEVLHPYRWDKVAPDYYAYQAINFSLSTGYLLLPIEYKSYDQTNINLYTELLGSRNMAQKEERYFVDLAPSVQFIFKSTAKLNIGYRFQLKGDIERIGTNSFMISYEHLFLNALKK